MNKPIDNSENPTSKKSNLDHLSEGNESSMIVDSADKFVLFPLDIQEDNLTNANSISQSKLTSQEDDFILFPLDLNSSSNTNNINNQPTVPSTNKKNQTSAKSTPPKSPPNAAQPRPNPTVAKSLPVVLKKAKLYWAVLFGVCGYAWAITEEYYYLGIISIVVSSYFAISYFYLKAKLSNSSIFKFIKWIAFLSLFSFGSYEAYKFISANSSSLLNSNDPNEAGILDSVDFMWDNSRKRMSVKDFASGKFDKLGYHVTNVSKESEGNYIVKCFNSDSIDIGLLYNVGVEVFLGDGNFRIKDKIKDFKGNEEFRRSTISSYFSNINGDGTKVLYVRRLGADSIWNKYEYEVPITFMSINKTNRLYWIYTVELVNGEISRISPKVINKKTYNQLDKQYNLKKKKKEEEVEPIVLQVEKKVDTDLFDQLLEPYLIVEEMPEFLGGAGAMMKYFAKNTQYPSMAREAGIGGKCFYSFVVAPSGDITDVRLSKGVPGCKECDEEAARVIKSMPKWKPGKQTGIAVAVRVTVPFNFSLK